MPQFALTTAWTKIAAAGATVDVQNLSAAPATITLSASAPASGADGEVLFGTDARRTFDTPLTNDLYARSATGSPVAVEVLAISAVAGGGGGSGGGAVTVADGANVAQGTTTDPSTAPTTIGLLKALKAGVVIPAGTNLIGKVGIDQTTPGTTNGMSLNQIAGSALALGQAAKAASLPVALPSDQVVSIQQPDVVVYGPTSLAALNAATSWIDTTGYNSITVTTTGTFVATNAYQSSTDSGSTNNPIVVGTAYNNTGNTSDAASDTAAGDRTFPVKERYFRTILTAYTSGTANVWVTLRSAPYAPRSVYATTTGAAAEAATASGNPVRIAGRDSGGLLRTLATDTSGNLIQGGNANLASNQATVTTTVGQIVASRSGRGSVTIINHGTTVVYFGGSGITASTGAFLAGIVGASVTILTSAAVYGITASGSQVVSYFETY